MAADSPDTSQLSSPLDALWVRDVGPTSALAQVTVPEAEPEPAIPPYPVSYTHLTLPTILRV